ncbi:hypothetical protein [Nostoc sp.]|uniref:hypothetical protein n=1 Tax=Nostoc sp. TaxID=1180 RepID=UPI003593CAD7
MVIYLQQTTFTAEGIRCVAINLLREGMSVEVVVRVTGLTVEQINQIKVTEINSQGE